MSAHRYNPNHNRPPMPVIKESFTDGLAQRLRFAELHAAGKKHIQKFTDAVLVETETGKAYKTTWYVSYSEPYPREEETVEAEQQNEAHAVHQENDQEGQIVSGAIPASVAPEVVAMSSVPAAEYERT